ncbi:MAG: hypothetical protein V1740_03130 [Candidatus Woesearchaeota archaeon]
MAEKLDKKYAWTGFLLIFLFWIPIFNLLIIIPLSIFFSIRSIKRIRNKPQEYGGMFLSTFALISAIFNFVLSVIILIFPEKIHILTETGDPGFNIALVIIGSIVLLAMSLFAILK